MYHSLHTLKPHGDITKFELEDGIIRGAVADLLAEPSSIAEIIVDIPRDATENLPTEIATPTDTAIIAITAASEADAVHDLRQLVSDFATIERTGLAERVEVTEVEKSWPGTATPGAALRVRADRTVGVDTTSFARLIADTAEKCRAGIAHSGLRIMTAMSDDSSLPSMCASIAFDTEEELVTALTSGAMAPLIDSDLLVPESRSLSMITEHRIVPNPNTW